MKSKQEIATDASKATWDSRFFLKRVRASDSFTQFCRVMANEPTVNGNIPNGSERSGTQEALKFAKHLYIHGGNISNWNRTKRKTTPNSADEVGGDLFFALDRSFIACTVQ